MFFKHWKKQRNNLIFLAGQMKTQSEFLWLIAKEF
jgi:hypothetical protein